MFYFTYTKEIIVNLCWMNNYDIILPLQLSPEVGKFG